MLTLQRASAGSGKTYTLAKKYLWYLVTIKPEGEHHRRLRSDEEIDDSARHILAVTFTNKATNEMQMRIVDKLYGLAYPPAYPPSRQAPDYMAEFAQELYDDYYKDTMASPREVAELLAAKCRRALLALLNNYSDFNVSTIDSFFQQVLRTFAYETDISESYQVELDSDYLSRMAIDASLEEIDDNSEDVQTPFWVAELMDRSEGGKWNIFQRSIGGKTTTPYSEFVNSVKRLENEEYKRIRGRIEEYFDSDTDLIGMYQYLKLKYELPVRQSYEVYVKLAKELYKMLPPEAQRERGSTNLGKIAMAYRRTLKSTSGSLKWNEIPASSATPPVVDDKYLAKKGVREGLDQPGVDLFAIRRQSELVAGAFTDWTEAVSNPEVQHWLLYSANFPYFGLFGIVDRKRRDYLEENNALELSETPVILQSIIDGSDAPFIYERLGTRLNHFLIDEFQDTSRLQWQNMSPLLHESMSRDNDNLVIGDEKQSIYRFRNADPGLIRHQLPSEFPSDRIEQRGQAPADNTNWRSDLRVVQFNNTFFRFLAKRITVADPSGKLLPDRENFVALYSNVVQNPRPGAKDGYVEVDMIKEGVMLAEGVPDNVETRLPRLVQSLRARGYRQRDIAVLVRTNTQGVKVINAFVAYNNILPPGESPIDFVSEQSLKIASSKAVKIVIGVLENVARGTRPRINPEGDVRRRKGVGDWAELQSDFKFYLSQHAQDGVPVSQIVDDFIREGTDMNALDEMLGRMQSLALPSLVEAAIDTFVPRDTLRRTDAGFLAAFQDLVLEYCDSHPTDIASFLRWWERAAENSSISSPENVDAVQVITVHKAKGLEYACVIVPYIDWNFKDEVESHHMEWRWVAPVGIDPGDYTLPPYLPVDVSKRMENTVYAPLLTRYYEMVKMDHINTVYVAFTRASRELYVMSPEVKGKNPGVGTLAGALQCFFGERDEVCIPGKDDARAILDSSAIEVDGEHGVVRVGHQPGETDVAEYYADKARKAAKESRHADDVELSSYMVNGIPEFLVYKEEPLPEVLDPEEIDIDADSDPRSEGNVKHAVLEHVRVADDLPRAVRKLRLDGLLTREMQSRVLASLTAALQRPDVRRWFDGKAEVICERPLLRKNSIFIRPDRLLVYPDGHAEVVDYKFGSSASEKTVRRHKRQVQGYVRRLRETGRFTAVIGYLWYVNDDRIIAV